MPHDGVLAQPTRARLFAALGELRRPAGTEELAALLDLHPNGVRTHLERMLAAGLVTREREKQARGRPRDRWAISATATPGGERPSAYAELGRILVRAMTAMRVPLRELEAAGREIGRDLAPQDTGAPPEERLHDALVGLGFQPTREHAEGDRLTYCLGNCPYRDVVSERQPLVCALHRGLTRGLLDEIDPAARLAGFRIEPPETAGCRIEVRGIAARDP